MAKQQKITLVYADDWQGIYIDGVLHDQNHRISPGDVLRALGLDHEDVGVDEDWLAENGTLPADLEDVRPCRG